ncbi:hypothetical protein ACFQV4_30545, partial [Streptomyces thermocarboxydus]
TELGVTDPPRPPLHRRGRRARLNWAPDTDPAAGLDTTRSDVLEDKGRGLYDIAETRRPLGPGESPCTSSRAHGRHDRVEAPPDGSKRNWTSTSSWSWSRQTRHTSGCRRTRRSCWPYLRRGPVPRPAAQARTAPA